MKNKESFRIFSLFELWLVFGEGVGEMLIQEDLEVRRNNEKTSLRNKENKKISPEQVNSKSVRFYGFLHGNKSGERGKNKKQGLSLGIKQHNFHRFKDGRGE